MQEDVLIDFKVDFSELTTAQEQLAKSGKIDPTAFAGINKAITKTATDTKGLIAEFKKVATTATQMGKSFEDAFASGIQDALSEAGVSAEEFSEKLAKANAPAKTLKQELRELKEALALAKANGKDTGVEFDAMRQRAGLLSDAIADANQEIKNAGSDTRGLDNVIGSISALAGGFAAVQGAAALFGDDSEDLQKTLVKVNATMAIASGIQQFYNATLKEGSLTKIADSIATGTQTAVQKLYTLATGKATAATVAFKVALAATGIGAAILLILALVEALDSTDTSLENVNMELERQETLLESTNQLIDRQTQLRLAQAKANGASQSAQIRIQAEGLQRQFEAISEINKGLREQRDRLDITSDAYGALNTRIEDNVKKQNDLRTELQLLNYEGRAAIQDEAEARSKALEDAAKKRKETAERAAADAKAARLAGLQDILAGLEKELLFVKKNSAEELDLKKKVIIAKRNIELEGDKLTANQLKLIKSRAYKDQLDLQEEFNKRATAEQLQAQQDTNAALLAGIALSSEERLRLQIENITLAAQQEINAAEGNAAKILLIEAKKLSDIRALQNKAIQDGLQAELQSSERTSNVVKAALGKLAADRSKDVDTRVEALRGIERQELSIVDKKIQANAEMQQSNEEYQENYKKLADERAQIEADTEQKISETIEDANEARKERILAIADITLEVLGQVAEFAAGLNQIATEQENIRIAEQKRQLESLVEAGAITEKEAKRRAQQIEILERQARQRQAQREKQEAVFSALLAIPQAALKGLVDGGPILAAIYGALAAAQAALVIARPVPKFFRGKQKGTHEGEGVVADMGAELVEQGGRMYLYTKPTQTYLAKQDRVFTAAQTRQILHNSHVNTTIHQDKSERFDYAKLAKVIPQSKVSINIEKDFISEAVADGLSKNNYFNKRYKF